PDQMVRLMVGRELSEMFPKLELELGAEILAVEGLTREGFFDDVTITVREHEIVGLAGLVGSGRTEVARAIFGLDRADAGDVRIRGRVRRIRRARAGKAAGIALVPEDRKGQGIVSGMSVRENFTLPVIERL